MPRDPHEFSALIATLVVRLHSRSAPTIADTLIPFLWPLSHSATRDEGCHDLYRDGVIKGIKGVLNRLPDPDKPGTRDFDEIHPGIMPFVQPLGRLNYWVPEMDEYVTVPELLAELSLLNSARLFMREKEIEVRNEADRLDTLYFEAIRRRDTGEPIFKPKPPKEPPSPDDDRPSP